ncbi:InlB B-repeat-containing protein [Butyrivibrio sp. AE3004]|uniref:InlB B-repeat-containing protein n=1 Tax=Butyrivibrio sp. AE3004 TaxID=1506994 RepID=UPI00049437BE|nr:InlB B-repeat-containing protein [Butyrivibrio sp. AE3004]
MKKVQRMKKLTQYVLMFGMALFMLLGIKNKAYAETKYNVWLGDTQITSENKDKIGTIINNGKGDSKDHFDPKTNTLHISNLANVTGTYESCYIYSKVPLTIKVGSLNFQNYGSDAGFTAIKCTEDLTIIGKYDIKGFYNGIECPTLTISGDKTSVKMENISHDGISAVGGTTINCSYIDIQCTRHGILSYLGKILFVNGHVKITANSEAILAQVNCLYIPEKQFKITNPSGSKVDNVPAMYTTLASISDVGSTKKFGARNIEVKPIENSNSVSVYFNFNGRTPDNATNPSILSLSKGAVVNSPATSIANGYYIEGWYTSNQCKDDEKFDFPQPVNKSIMLYAKWKKLTEYDVWVAGIRVNEFNKNNILPKLDGKITYNPATSTLYFSNVTMNDVYGTVGNYNTIVYSKKDLSITGNATLTVSKDYVTPIYCDQSSLCIDGIFSLSGGEQGIWAYKGVEISGKDTRITINKTGVGINSEKSITLLDGSLTVNNCSYYGLHTNTGTIDIAGGKSNITGDRCALYGGISHDIAIRDNITVKKPEKYSKGQYFGDGLPGYYTITDKSTNKPAKTVITDFSIPKYTVKFDLNGKQGTIPADQLISEGQKASRPLNVTSVEGFTIDCWTTDAAGNNKYDFNTPVKSSFTLYAKWVETSNNKKPDLPEKQEEPVKKQEEQTKSRVESTEFYKKIQEIDSNILIGKWNKYVVTSTDESNPTVSFDKFTNKKGKKVTIPNTIAYEGVTYKVTGIRSKAFSGCKKLKTITVGANVETIDATAFKGAPGLTKITIKSTKLTKKTVSNKAFSSIGKNVAIKVPAKKKAAYGKLFAKKGLSKSAVIK